MSAAQVSEAFETQITEEPYDPARAGIFNVEIPGHTPQIIDGISLTMFEAGIVQSIVARGGMVHANDLLEDDILRARSTEGNYAQQVFSGLMAVRATFEVAGIPWTDENEKAQGRIKRTIRFLGRISQVAELDYPPQDEEQANSRVEGVVNEEWVASEGFADLPEETRAKLEGFLNIDRLGEVLADLKLSERQLYLMSAIFAFNGRQFSSADVRRHFQGNPGTTQTALSFLTSRLERSDYASLFKRTALGRAARYQFGTEGQWYPPEYESLMHEEVAARIAAYGTGKTRPSKKTLGTHPNTKEQRRLYSRKELPLIDSVDEDEKWQDRALCAQTDPESFFPDKGGSTKEAKKVCQACEVRVNCLDAALQQDERFGIWGGLSERERRKLKKRAI